MSSTSAIATLRSPDAAGSGDSLLGAFRDWLLDVRPAALARRHLTLTALFAAIAVAAALAMHFELLTPMLDRLEAHTFGALLSLHGMLMIYVVAIPAFPAVLGHALLPKALGIDELPFPRLARSAWHLHALAGIVLVLGFLAGGTEAGWMFDAEFGGRFTSPNTGPAALGVLLAALALSTTSLSLVATILVWRRDGDRSRPIPPVVSAFFLAGASGLVAGAFLIVTTALILVDRLVGISLFDWTAGGDPQLFAALFRRFVSPAFSVVLLGALGTVMTVIAARAEARPTRREGVLTGIALAVIALAGLVVWVGPEGPVGGSPSSDAVTAVLNADLVAAAGFLIAGILALLKRGGARIDTAMMYALGFLPALVLSLCTGLLLAIPATRAMAASTAFATTQLHLTMLGALAMAFLSGVHHVWPELVKRRISEPLGRAAAALTIFGLWATLLPSFLIGLAGQSFRVNAYPPELVVPHVLTAAGSTILIAGVVIAGLNLATGQRVGAAQGESDAASGSVSGR